MIPKHQIKMILIQRSNFDIVGKSAVQHRNSMYSETKSRVSRKCKTRSLISLLLSAGESEQLSLSETSHFPGHSSPPSDPPSSPRSSSHQPSSP